jgi:hypothetical protein
MTEAIRDYIAKMPSADGDGWRLLKRVSDKLDLEGKFKAPFFEAESVGTFYLVGEVQAETNEETGETTETFTITHLEFIDWGILPEDEEEEELTDEQIAEAVQEVVNDLLDFEIGAHEHAYYNSFHGFNLYRAPLKNTIVVVRKGNEVTLA